MGDPDASPINLMLAKCKSSSDQKGSQFLTYAAPLVSCREAGLIGGLLPIAIGNLVSLSQSTDALNPKFPRLNYNGVWASACGVLG